MSQIQTFPVAKGELIIRSGQVMGEKVWSESHVSGGGSGFVYKGIGFGSSRTRTKVVNKRELWVKFEDGTEDSFTFPAEKVKVREGQYVTLVGYVGKGRAALISIYNHATREQVVLGGMEAIEPGKYWLAMGAVPGTIIGLISLGNGHILWGLVFLAGLAWMPKFFKEKAVINEAISQANASAKAIPTESLAVALPA